MNLRHIVFASLTTIALLGTAHAQVRTGRFDLAIGNANVGGAVHAHATTAIDRTVLRTLHSAEALLRGNVNILGATTEAAEVFVRGTNMTSNFLPPTRSGLFRLEVRGVTFAVASAAGSVGFTTRTVAFNAFTGDVARTMTLGPTSITLRGNASCSVTTGGAVSAPTTSSNVGMNANATMLATPRFSGSTALPGGSLSVTHTGSVWHQTLVTSSGISASAFVGSTSYLLRTIAMRTDVVLSILGFSWRQNLANISRAATSLMLI